MSEFAFQDNIDEELCPYCSIETCLGNCPKAKSEREEAGRVAAEDLGLDWGTLNQEERWVFVDSVSNGEDVEENWGEYCWWRSGQGRAAAAEYWFGQAE